jgi:hypothetical protein
VISQNVLRDRAIAKEKWSKFAGYVISRTEIKPFIGFTSLAMALNMLLFLADWVYQIVLQLCGGFKCFMAIYFDSSHRLPRIAICANLVYIFLSFPLPYVNANIFSQHLFFNSFPSSITSEMPVLVYYSKIIKLKTDDS